MYQIEFECQAFFLHAAENPESVENPETVEKAESGQNAESEEFRRPLKIEKRGKPEIVENADTTVKKGPRPGLSCTGHSALSYYFRSSPHAENFSGAENNVLEQIRIRDQAGGEDQAAASTGPLPGLLLPASPLPGLLLPASLLPRAAVSASPRPLLPLLTTSPRSGCPPRCGACCRARRPPCNFRETWLSA